MEKILLKEKISNLEKEISELKKENEFLRERLTKIETGRLWRILRIYFIFRDKIIHLFKRLFFSFGQNNTELIQNKVGPKADSKAFSILDMYDYKKIKEKVLSAIRVDSFKKFIPIVTTSFLKNNKEFFYGGGERYIVNLIKLMQKIDKKVCVLQLSEKFFVKKTSNFFVIGIGISTKYWEKGSIVLQKLVEDLDFNFPIYSPYHLKNDFGKKSIGISHCLYHDFPNNGYYWKENNQFFLQRAKYHNLIVAVDTGFLNWLRALDYSIFEKSIYVPNFVDLSEFYPRSIKEKIVLYPRSIYKSRGIDLFISAAKLFLKKYADYKVYITGELVDKSYLKTFRLLKKTFGERFIVDKRPFNEMADIYRRSEIVVIPSVNSEGTSLSVLEAMACGCVPVVTWVGGLSDIVIDGFNGLLVKPDFLELYNAFKKLIEDRKLYRTLKKNAFHTVKTFSLEKWENRWLKIIKNFYEKSQDISR